MKKKVTTLLTTCCAMLLTIPAMAAAPSAKDARALTAKQASIIPIAAFTAHGDAPKLKEALAEGLENGLTVNEIKEVLVQMYAYTGFPRSLTGLNTFIALLGEREQRGIKDEVGRDASPLPADKSVRELGTAIQTEIVGKAEAERAGRLLELVLQSRQQSS